MGRGKVGRGKAGWQAAVGHSQERHGEARADVATTDDVLSFRRRWPKGSASQGMSAMYLSKSFAFRSDETSTISKASLRRRRLR